MFQNDIVPLAKKLIQIPSVSGNYAQNEKILALIESVLSEFDVTQFYADKHKSLIFHTTPLDRRFAVILNAHVDVVPGDKKQFTPVEKNGKIFGRGAFDMKAAAAVMILLFKEVAKRVPYPLALQIVTDEETGGQNGTAFQVKKGIRGDFVITGEGTKGRIIHKAKMRLTLKVSTKGKSAHSAYPWLGENAIHQMHQALNTLFTKFPVPSKESNNTTITLSRIETTNNAYNKIPDDCSAYLDIRIPPEIQYDVTLDIITTLSRTCSVEVILKGTPHFISPDNRYIKTLLEASRYVLGTYPALAMAHGTSDIPYFIEAGCDGIEFGLSGDNHHSVNEWVSIESIYTYYAIMKRFLMET